MASEERKDPRGTNTLGNIIIIVVLEFNTTVRPWAESPSTGWTRDKFMCWLRVAQEELGKSRARGEEDVDDEEVDEEEVK